ncbi:MAG: FliI/YscN family ATPase [Acidimicrobiales bacterium]|nr:FliI/YscN family ATPase [Acidimicrobiales bacterium]
MTYHHAQRSTGPRLHALLGDVAERLDGVASRRVLGRVSRLVGLEVEARGVPGAIGDLMWLGEGRLPAEVIAIREDAVVLMPIGELEGIAAGDLVEAAGEPLRLTVGPGLVGRVLDGLGRPIDDLGPIQGQTRRIDYAGSVPNPLKRQRIADPLPLGVRVVDTMLTCGVGQRVGIMAGSGVGKSTLLGMMARGTEADVVVVGLVGERGREVREFLEDDLGPVGCARSVVVVATSDEPPLLRLRAAFTATRIAELYADEGLNVLLLVDSLTRFAMAQRDVGLAAGEPPTTRGYPPSVFGMLPRLLERAGPRERGSITGIYTVLVEGDDMNEPVADHARSILDGHIVLSRRLAAAGHYPTVDVLDSASRLAGKLLSADRLADVRSLRTLLAAWEEARDLVEIGAYRPGTNAHVDEYLAKRDSIDAFLRQNVDDIAEMGASWEELRLLVGGPVPSPVPVPAAGPISLGATGFTG